jgi:hypothetical protein
VSVQVDIAFGDVIIPESSKIEYPVILDFPRPELCGYSKESTIAEKFETMTRLGVLNSRMRDFYDIWLLSHQFDFKGETLATALQKTFDTRGTEISANPTAFRDSFANDREKVDQWRAFLRRSRLDNAPKSLREVVTAVKIFIEPPVASLADEKPFRKTWVPPGPWR